MPWIERYVLLRGDKYAERQRDLSRGKLEHEIRMLWHKHARRSCPDPKNWLRHFDDDDVEEMLRELNEHSLPASDVFYEWHATALAIAAGITPPGDVADEECVELPDPREMVRSDV